MGVGRRTSKVESNDSPKIPDRRRHQITARPPFGRVGNKMLDGLEDMNWTNIY